MRIKGSELKKIIREEISRSIRAKSEVLSEAVVPQGLIDSAHRKLSTILGQFPFALEAALANLRMLADNESPLAQDFAQFLNGPFGKTNPVDVGNRVVVGLITGNLQSGGSLIQTIGTMGYRLQGLNFDGTEIPTFINSPESRAARDALVERVREIVNFAEPQEIGEMIHMVKSGDTLWDLSNKYGTTVKAIMDKNNLRSDMIMVGQRLIIPQ